MDARRDDDLQEEEPIRDPTGTWLEVGTWENGRLVNTACLLVRAPWLQFGLKMGVGRVHKRFALLQISVSETATHLCIVPFV